MSYAQQQSSNIPRESSRSSPNVHSQYMSPQLQLQPAPQMNEKQIHEWYRNPVNRQQYSNIPQYKYLFDQYDKQWGTYNTGTMKYSSIFLIGGVTIAAGLLGIKYGLRTIRSLKPGNTQPITDVDDAVNRMRSTFYLGGFERDMSKREASLILGCRESSTKEKIMERYRILMKLNHPDLGGSPHLSAKINDAKELLSKTARSEADTKR